MGISGTEQLVQHWLAVEEGARDGCRRGAPPARSVALASLEGLAARPRHTLQRLRRWLGLAGATDADAAAAAAVDAEGKGAEVPAWAEPWAASVRAAPNARYAAAYAARLAASARAREELARIGARFGARIGAVSGYADLRNGSASYEAPPLRDAAWRREWLRRDGRTVAAHDHANEEEPYVLDEAE